MLPVKVPCQLNVSTLSYSKNRFPLNLTSQIELSAVCETRWFTLGYLAKFEDNLLSRLGVSFATKVRIVRRFLVTWFNVLFL